MEILNGKVQWNGRDDIPCTYGKTEDGKLYYFIPEEDGQVKDLSNGSHIATTTLLEAVDKMAKASKIGVVDNAGTEVIPCANKSVKVVDGDVLLVEPAEPVSENVIEANNLRMDPLSATRLVSTPAQIKEKIPAIYYLLNNQFSEATLADVNGINLVNGEMYSFIARDGDKLFMAKNYPETDVTEFSIADKKIVEPVKEEVVEIVEETPVEEKAPVTENINEGFAREDVDLGQTIDIPTVNGDIAPENFDVVKETAAEEINGSEVAVESEEDGIVETETGSEESELERRLRELNEKYSGYINTMETNIPIPTIEKPDAVKDMKEEAKEEDIFADTKVDSIDGIEYDDESTDLKEYYAISDNKDNTMEEAIKVIGDFKQKFTDTTEKLSEALSREEKLKNAKRILSEKTKAQEEKIGLLDTKNRELLEDNGKYKAKIESLTMALDLQKRKSEEQKRTITEQNREIERLNKQLDGKEELVSALESVKALIGGEESYSDEDYYSKVA